MKAAAVGIAIAASGLIGILVYAIAYNAARINADARISDIERCDAYCDAQGMSLIELHGAPGEGASSAPRAGTSSLVCDCVFRLGAPFEPVEAP